MTGPSRKKRLYYGPWKVRRHKPVHQIIITQGPNGSPRIVVEGYKELERKVGPGVPWTESRREERDQVDLHSLAERLKLKDTDFTLLELMKGGIETIFRLAHTYQWYLQKEEEKRHRPEILERERQQRKKEREEELKYRAKRRAEEKQKRLKLLKEKREKAAKEKARRLEIKKEEAEERAKKKALKDHQKKVLAEKLRKEKEEEAESKRWAQTYWRPVQRTMDV